MAQYVRRQVASVQLSIAAGVLGVLAGLGLGRGSQPPQVDAQQAANRVITINGSNIVDGSVAFRDLNRKSIRQHIYLKLDADKRYLKIRDADARFHKLITNELGGYIKLGEADSRYLKLDALNGYLKLADAEAEFVKHETLADYIKGTEADARFVDGDGSVLTGSQLVDSGKKTLLTVPKALSVEAATDGQGRGAVVTLTNLTSSVLEYVSNAKTAAGGDAHGSIDQGSSVAILIGLLQPASVQIVPKDGSSVHTLDLSAFDESGGLTRVVGQALSGAPPPAG